MRTLIIGLGLSSLVLGLIASSSGCSASGDAADRLARLEQSIAAVETEASTHEGKTRDLADLSALAQIEALHQKRLEAIAGDLLEETLELDACGYRSCCQGALDDLEVQNALLLAGIDAHQQATSNLGAMAELPFAESTHREAIDLITTTLRGHHESMTTASMCCHCQSMHDGR